MTVCTFYAQLGTLLGNHKNNEFLGKFPAGKKLPASVENHFHSEAIGFVHVQYSLLQVQLNLQKKRDSSLMKTTPRGGCHETAYVVGKCFHFGFRHCNQARDRVKSSFETN